MIYKHYCGKREKKRNTKHLYERTYAPLCSLQHYLQSPSYGSIPSVYEWVK